MKKRIFSKALALFMTLSLLSTTAFAAMELNDANIGDHIDQTSGALLGYIADEGSDTRSYDYFLGSNITLDKTLTVSNGVNATLDLNGYTLALNTAPSVTTDESGYVTNVTAGNADGSTVKTGSVIQVTGGAALTVQDTDVYGGNGGATGTITGGNAATFGGGIRVDGGTLVMTGGEISGNTAKNNGGGVYVNNGKFEMSGDASITENYASHGGGGVFLNSTASHMNNQKAEFVMDGGSITGNATGKNGQGLGGGVGASANAENIDTSYNAITITGGEISGNFSGGNGGGIYILGGGLAITGGEISGNKANQGGGLYSHDSKAEIENASITGNTAGSIGGGIFNVNSHLEMKSGEVCNNMSGKNAADVYHYRGSIKLPSAQEMGAAREDGKAISGWYFDGNDRWGNGLYAYYLQPHEYSGSSALYLKAAHDEYFTVTFTDGADGAVFADQTVDLEKGTATPNFDGEPTREGFTFTGWQLSEDGELGDTVTRNITLVAQWEPIPADEPDEPDTPAAPVMPEIPGVMEAGADTTTTTTIADEEIPLAGLVSVAQLLEALRLHDGIADVELPEDFQWIDHEYAQAIYWGLAEQFVTDAEETPLDPDEVVTVAILRGIMTAYAAYLDTTFDVAIEEEDDMIVMNCDEILSAFYEAQEAKAA